MQHSEHQTKKQERKISLYMMYELRMNISVHVQLGTMS